MLRYRCNAGTTQKAIAKISNVKKIGQVYRIIGKRYVVHLKEGYSSTREVVYLYGEKGTARFLGFLWGYHGEGPRGLIRLLKYLGLNNTLTESVPFHFKRGQNVGIDWEINISKNGEVNFYSRNN